MAVRNRTNMKFVAARKKRRKFYWLAAGKQIENCFLRTSVLLTRYAVKASGFIPVKSGISYLYRCKIYIYIRTTRKIVKSSTFF